MKIALEIITIISLIGLTVAHYQQQNILAPAMLAATSTIILFVMCYQENLKNNEREM